MRPCSSTRIVALAALLAAGVAGPARAQPPPAVPALRPGTYAQVLPGTNKLVTPGNQVVLVRGRTGRLSFSVNAIRALDENQGFVAGTLAANGRRVVWQQRADGANCRLTFTATATGLTVAQDLAFGDCGFGNGVIADGSYVRTADDGKLAVPPGP